jgi:ribosome-associated translation inhibitor RaiA
MGYLTTITISNDAYGDIEKHQKEFTEGVLQAMNGTQINRGRDYFSVGSFANPVTLQKPRHADDTTLYMHAGNTVIDVFEADSDWAIDSFIAEMEYHLKRLKEIKKNKGK